MPVFWKTDGRGRPDHAAALSLMKDEQIVPDQRAETLGP
jgi:hypothetical protein